MIPISAITLIQRGAEDLLPQDMVALADACWPSNDRGAMLVLADWLKDRDESPDLEFALRWMVKHGKIPEHKAWYGTRGFEGSSRLPPFLCLLNNDDRIISVQCTGKTWLQAVAFLAERLKLITAALDVTMPPVLPNDSEET